MRNLFRLIAVRRGSAVLPQPQGKRGELHHPLRERKIPGER